MEFGLCAFSLHPSCVCVYAHSIALAHLMTEREGAWNYVLLSSYIKKKKKSEREKGKKKSVLLWPVFTDPWHVAFLI